MSKVTQQELDNRLNKNGWMWHLVSAATPGVIRIQLGSDGVEEDGWRKSIEAPTFEQAMTDAEAFVNSISASDYAKGNRPHLKLSKPVITGKLPRKHLIPQEVIEEVFKDYGDAYFVGKWWRGRDLDMQHRFARAVLWKIDRTEEADDIWIILTHDGYYRAPTPEEDRACREK